MPDPNGMGNPNGEINEEEEEEEDYDGRESRLRCISMPVRQRGSHVDPYWQREVERMAMEQQEQLEQDKEELLALVEQQQQKIAAMQVKTVEAEREKARISSELAMLQVTRWL